MLLLVVGVGLPTALRRPAVVPLLVLAAAAVVLPAALATGPGVALLEALVREVPGLGVLRDGQKWVALAMPGYALAAGCAVVTLRPRVPTLATATVCCLALLAVLPDLAWGVGGKVTAVRYPPGWATVAALINADPRPVAVLPPDIMREFSWAGTAPVLDPLPRSVSADVLATGRSDDRWSDRSRRRRAGPRGAAAARVRGGRRRVGTKRRRLGGRRGGRRDSPDRALDLPVVHRDGDLTLYRVGGDRPAADGRAAMIAAHLVWMATLIAGGVGTAAGALARRRH